MKHPIFATVVAGLCLALAGGGCADETVEAPATAGAIDAGLTQTQDVPSAEAVPEEPPPGAVEPSRDRLHVRGERAERRTFDGAPPVIPHDVNEFKEDCMLCHKRPLSAGGKWSPQMSHPYYSQCKQCHVHASPKGPAGMKGGPPDLPTTFEPLRIGQGTRTTPGSPPTIPHEISFMRSDCSACHGVSDSGVRPEHYKRTQCTQCHVPDAWIDAMAAMDPPDFPVAVPQR